MSEPLFRVTVLSPCVRFCLLHIYHKLSLDLKQLFFRYLLYLFYRPRNRALLKLSLRQDDSYISALYYYRQLILRYFQSRSVGRVYSYRFISCSFYHIIVNYMTIISGHSYRFFPAKSYCSFIC